MFLEQQISILCDTGDWSNDAENSAFITGISYILRYFHIENTYFKIAIIFHDQTVFDQINVALVSRRDFINNIE